MRAVPVFLRQIHDVGAARDARVVDQRVDTAESRDHFRDHAIDLRDAAKVGSKCQAAPAETGNCRGRFLHALAIDIHGRHIGTGLRHGQRARLAYALSSAGNQSHLTRQIHPHLLLCAGALTGSFRVVWRTAA